MERSWAVSRVLVAVVLAVGGMSAACQSEFGEGAGDSVTHGGLQRDGEDVSAASQQWSTFRIVQSWGPCPVEGGCIYRWTVNRDDLVLLHDGDDGQNSYSLADEDYGTVVEVVTTAQFMEKMSAGFSCAEPTVTDVFEEFQVVLEDGTSMIQAVTGCVFGPEAPADADAGTLHETVTKYQ